LIEKSLKKVDFFRNICIQQKCSKQITANAASAAVVVPLLWELATVHLGLERSHVSRWRFVHPTMASHAFNNYEGN
jgi:hypothetical protein